MNTILPKRTRPESIEPTDRQPSSRRNSSLGTDRGAFVAVSERAERMAWAQEGDAPQERGRRWGGSVRRDLSSRSYSPIRDKKNRFRSVSRRRTYQPPERATKLLDDQSVDHEMHDEFRDWSHQSGGSSSATGSRDRRMSARRSFSTANIRSGPDVGRSVTMNEPVADRRSSLDRSVSTATFETVSTRGTQQLSTPRTASGIPGDLDLSATSKQRKSKLAKIQELRTENNELMFSIETIKRQLKRKEQRIRELEHKQRDPLDDKQVQALMKLTSATKQQQQSLLTQQAKYAKVKKELEKSQKEIKWLKKDYTRRDDEAAELENELDDKLTEISELRKQLSQTLQESDRYREQNEADRAKIIQLTKELTLVKSGSDESFALTEQLEVFERETVRRNSEMESQRIKLANQAERIRQLELELTKAETSVGELEKERDRSLALLDKANDKLKKDLTEKQLLFEEAQKEKVSLQEIEDSQSKLSLALRDAREELEEMRLQKEEAKLTFEERSLAMTDLEEENKRLQKRLDAVLLDLEEAHSRYKSLDEEHNEVRHKLQGELGCVRQSMSELQEAFEEVNERNRELIEAEAKNDGLISIHSSELEDLRKLNSELEVAVETVSQERDEWKLAAEMAKAKAGALAQEKDQLREQLTEEATELREVNAEMESEIQLLIEERDSWRKAAERAEVTTSEFRAALAEVEKTKSERAQEDIDQYQSSHEKLLAEIERLTQDRDSWKQAAESKLGNEKDENGLSLSANDGSSELDKQSNHSSEGENPSDSQQAHLLEAAAAEKKRKDFDRAPSRSWFARIPSSKFSLGDSIHGGVVESDDPVEDLRKTNAEHEETIAKLRSELVRLSSTYKEETYLNKKKIESLAQENAAYEIKVKALEKEMETVSPGASPGPES